MVLRINRAMLSDWLAGYGLTIPQLSGRQLVRFVNAQYPGKFRSFVLHYATTILKTENQRIAA